jgi:hypothetical protein
MKNNQPIVLELVTAIEICCRQVNTMTRLTGRSMLMTELQERINRCVDDFKLLYKEIPNDSEFIVETAIDGLLFIAANQVFRDYVEVEERSNIVHSTINKDPFMLNTLH